MAGVAAALLVFTGIWHMTEWMMGGRNRDTLRLVPVGVAYAVLGWWIALGTGGWGVQLLALGLTAAGLTGAVLTRNTAAVRPWVTWAFVLIDAVIILALAISLL